MSVPSCMFAFLVPNCPFFLSWCQIILPTSHSQIGLSFRLLLNMIWTGRGSMEIENIEGYKSMEIENIEGYKRFKWLKLICKQLIKICIFSPRHVTHVSFLSRQCPTVLSIEWGKERMLYYLGGWAGQPVFPSGWGVHPCPKFQVILIWAACNSYLM